MQAWWVSYFYENSTDFVLHNSLGVYVAVTKENGDLRWAIHDKTGTLKSNLSIEEAKVIVAHKFATMLAEQAVAVLTIGA